MQFTFRWLDKLNQVDGSMVIELFNSVIMTETVIGFTEQIEALEGESIIQTLNLDLSLNRIKLLLMTQHGNAAAMVIYKTNQQPNCKHMVDLSKGIIHPTYRGANLLREAFLEISAQCTRDGVDLITLDVRKNSRPHMLWSKLGFKQYGELVDYARVNGESCSGIYMYQTISDLIANVQTMDKGN